MGKFLKKTGLWLLAIFLLFFILLLPAKSYIYESKKKRYLVEHKPELDLLILGSSRAQHVVKAEIFAQNGYRVFNIGEDGQGYPSTYLMLKLLIEKYGIKTKSVLVTADEMAFNGTKSFSRKFRDNCFVSDIEDPEVFEAYSTYRNPAFAWMLRIFPQISYLIYGSSYRFFTEYRYNFHDRSASIEKRYQKLIEKESENLGYVPLEARKIRPQDDLPRTYTIDEDDKFYFEKLVSYCKEKGIRLYLLRVPLYHCNNFSGKEFDTYIQGFSREHNIPFFDYKCTHQDENQFYNSTHPADSVAGVVTRDLLNRIGQTPGGGL